MIQECLVVEFRVTGDDCPLAEASAAVDVPLDAAPPLLRPDGYTLERFSTPGGGANWDPDAGEDEVADRQADAVPSQGAIGDTADDETVADAVAAILDADERVRYLHRTEGEEGPTFRCLSKEPCVVHRLVDEGFLVESIRYRGGAERHVGAVVGQSVLRGVLQTAGETVGVELVRISPLGQAGDGGADVASRWNLTPGQAEALETAHELGYYAVPRDASAAEVAAELGVSKSAFLERLRRAEGALLDRVLE